MVFNGYGRFLAMKQHFMLIIKLTVITYTYGPRIFMKSRRMCKIYQKLMFFCGISISRQRFMAHSSLTKTMMGENCLKMLRTWLFPHHEDSDDFIFQQDGAPLHWHSTIQQFLNDTISILGRVCGTLRHCPTLLVSKISRHNPLWLLVGIHERLFLFHY